MRSFEEMKEIRFKKNVLGLLLTICGAYIVITAVFSSLLRTSGTIVILGLVLGIIMMIAGLFFMELLVKGFALVFSGIQLVLFDQLLSLIDGGSPAGDGSLLVWMGVPISIIGIILVIIGFRE